MKFLKIFRTRKIDVLHDDTVLFYHEDDFCQAELSPKENLSFFQKESEEIKDLAEKALTVMVTRIHMFEATLKSVRGNHCFLDNFN